MIGVGLIVWWVYAYQIKIDNMMIEAKKQAIVLAHDTFFPDERKFNHPLQQYEQDSLTDILSYYERDDRQKKIFFIPDPTNYLSKIEIEGVHYETFTPIDQSWSRDKDTLYKDGKVFMDRLQVPKMMVGGVYLKNNTEVYYSREGMTNHIQWADASSFQPLYAIRYYTTIPYAKDENHVYMLDKIIDTIDPQTVEVLASFYIQDKKNIVYFDGEVYHILKWVDRQTFEVVSDRDDYDAKDKKGYFYQGERVDLIVFD